MIKSQIGQVRESKNEGQSRKYSKGEEKEQENCDKIIKQKVVQCRYNPQNMQIRLLFWYAVLAAGLITLTQQVQAVTEDVINQIFKQNKIYMIYVTEDNDILMESYLSQYCYHGRNCAVLNRMSHMFVDVFNYVGRDQLEYFLIIDAARKLKYIMPVIEGMTVNDLYIFHSKFEQGLLEPFYASEKPQKDTYPPCRKVVGKNLDQFLAKQAPLKVLYLYSDQTNFCQSCGQILRNFADYAEKTYDQKTIIFGYYHILKNDHPLIKDEIHPYFLIFTDKPHEAPIGVPGDSLQKLQDQIIEMITTKRKVNMNPDLHIKPTQQPREQQL